MRSALTRLGQRIRSLREGAGLTQESLADLSKLDAKHVQLIEAGKTNTTVASLIGIARAIEVPVQKLFEGV